METLALSLLPKLASALNILYVALGLGLVIFIHELGHFLVAKWCGVKVERFSIGFGPILWKYVRGETEYALSAIPFGGYVKMLGQDDADPSQMASERLARDPRSYTAKSVPQRMAIISAGVINNMASAVVFFVIAFMLGVKYQPAVVGQVVPGKPAWVGGLRLGDEITRVNNRTGPHLGFIDIRQAVALSERNESILVEGLRDGKPFATEIVPEVGGLFPTIFVEPELALTLAEDSGGKSSGPAAVGLPASEASPPFEWGDELKAIDDVPLGGYADLQRALAAKRGETVECAVKRKGQPDSAPLVKIRVPPGKFRTLGMKMAIGTIQSIQNGSPAEGKLKPGDTITHVAAEEAEWQPVGVKIDPLELPDWFAERAGRSVRVKIKRNVDRGNPATEEVDLVPEDRAGWIERPDYDKEDCPLSVPAIGVAYHVTHHVESVDPEGPAARAEIPKDADLVKIEFVLPEGAAEDGYKTPSFKIDFDNQKRNWPAAFWLMQKLPLRELKVTFKPVKPADDAAKPKEGKEGKDESVTVGIVPEEAPDWYLTMRGFVMQQHFETRKAENIGEALTLGFRHTRDSIIDMWMTVKGLTSGRISPNALGGPIRIFGTAYYFSKLGIPDLILFLGMLSVSLAVLNFLPIPVLDGGHFMFLCWEGIRGKPPSDWVVVTATYVGLAMVLSLMAWVMYVDISGMIG